MITAPQKDNFADDIMALVQRRQAASKKIADSLAHFSPQQMIYVVTSFIPIDELEAALPTICGGNPTEDAAIAADFAASGKMK